MCRKFYIYVIPLYIPWCIPLYENPRELRALAIISRGNQIHRINSTTYRVKSQNGNGNYLVIKETEEWICECPDHKFREVKCKHIHSVELSSSLRKKVTSDNLGVERLCVTPPESCKYCGSIKIVKRGYRKNRNGLVQRFYCKDCQRRFIVKEDGFQKIRCNPKIITVVLDLYFKGISLRKIQDHMKMMYDFKVHYSTLLRWIQKYIAVMKSYVNDLQPEVSDVWHIDEMMIKVKGEWDWMWNIMDADTRFLLANHVSKGREIEDARKVFQDAKMKAKAKPMTIVSDGLRAYEGAVKKEFYTLKNPRTKHIRKPRFIDPTSNNLVERLQGTVRERNKVMRGLKDEKSVFFEGQQIYYNYIRPHSSLNGKTPAEASNIDLNLKGNKWMKLIKQSIVNKSQCKGQ